ncbi:hypothetical protein FACS1894199_10290 [Bacteroidia bacterium]|nr:hypothetical protein FACS1894199_10290 [Bacteroidia bacterium]
MNKNYITLIAGLPDIVWNDWKLPFPVRDFRAQAEIYINGRDADLLNMLFLRYDNQQILNLLNKMDTVHGTHDLDCVYPVSLLEEEVAEPTGALPPYLNEFITKYKETAAGDELQDVQHAERVLTGLYYEYMMTSGNEFLEDFAAFSMNVKNLVTALNCRKYGKDFTMEIIGENEFSNALKSAHSKDFGLSAEHTWVEKVIAAVENNNLVERERSLDLLVWDAIEEGMTFRYFSIERVLGFAAELLIVERWSKMDSESGRQVFEEMIAKFKENVTFG